MAGVRLTTFKDGRHCLSFYLDGRRQRETFIKLRDAQLRKNEVARHMGRGIHAKAKAEAIDEESVQYALSRLEASGIAKPLSAVIDEYIAAQKALGSTGSLIDACKAHAENKDKVIPITTRELVANYERYLIGQKVSDAHVEKTAKIYLKRFATDLPQAIDTITLKELQDWRSTFTSGPRTINNYCNAVKALFNYAQDHSHVRKDRKNEANKLKDIEEPATGANPFTIQEMAVLLTGSDEDSLPFIVLGAFAGIRTAEQKRLQWEKHVRWETGYFDLTGDVTKKKLRRLVPILPAAAAWLKPYKNRKGPIISVLHPERAPTEILKKHKLNWRHNGLRDAFGSNRAAIVKNLNGVAMEMGNSPAMVIESYREVVSEEEGAKFWNLLPSMAAKIAKAYLGPMPTDAKKNGGKALGLPATVRLLASEPV